MGGFWWLRSVGLSSDGVIKQCQTQWIKAGCLRGLCKHLGPMCLEVTDACANGSRPMARQGALW